MQKLLDINELDADGLLEADQIIFLQKKAKNGEKDFVLVQRNETIYEVAQQNGVQLQSLLLYNHLSQDGAVSAGTKLYLKAVAEKDQAASVAKRAAVTTPIMYQVQPKEGLYTVAKKYSVTVQQLRDWNNLTSDDLKIGQQLIVGK